MKVKKDCQVIISPLLQSMLGLRQAIFPAGEYVSDWVAYVKKGLNAETHVEFILEFRPVFFPIDGFEDPFGRGIIPIR
jgi:hypothetical protein